ncbi:MAG: type II toxin-antitoxin system death-on-curing family toxin [Candidatus Omnitrophota bacterium]
MQYDQPFQMPSLKSCDLGRLESCLNTPFQTVGGKDAYRGLAGKAAVLFYLISKNHCFINGNKRIAVVSTLTFLLLNKKWLQMSMKGLYDISMEIAGRDASSLDIVLPALEGIFRKYLIDEKAFVSK